VRNAINIPGDAHGIKESHAYEQPPGSDRKNGKKCQDVRKMKDAANHGNGIPF
jgi:hypothetical protein